MIEKKPVWNRPPGRFGLFAYVIAATASSTYCTYKELNKTEEERKGESPKKPFITL